MDTSSLSRRIISVILVFFSMAAISPVRGAYVSIPGPTPGPTPIICTDKAVYFERDILTITLSGWNYGPEWITATKREFDVYVRLLALFAPLYLDSTGIWSTSEVPCLTNQQIGSKQVNYVGYYTSYVVLPNTPTGLYTLETGVRLMGSPNWASQLNAVSFWVVPESGMHYYVNSEKGTDIPSAGSETSPWRTITYALNHAYGIDLKNSTTIHVAKGTYSPSTPSTPGETFPLILQEWVSLRGEKADETIIDAKGSAYHVIVCAENWSVVDGFTIKGGKAVGPKDEDQRGGGVYCAKGKKIVLQNNIIEVNTAEYGAGVCINEGFAIIHNNIIQDNEAFKWGGAIVYESKAGGSIVCNTIRQNNANCGAGIYCDDSKPEIHNNVINNNEAKESGGGIHCESGSPLIESNMINENQVLANNGMAAGGGIYCFDSSSPTITNNAIIKNSATGAESKGGGISSNSATPKIFNNIIYGNEAMGSLYGNGGGIYDFGSSLEVKDCSIFNNKASLHGGGICCEATQGTIWNNIIHHNIASNADGGGIYWDGLCIAPKILSNTIADNHADLGSGGGIWVGINTGLIIENCIIYGNSDSVSGQLELLSSVQPSYCCIQDWPGAGTGYNIDDNPMFKPGPYGDYYLDHGTPQSQCIDKGSVLATTAKLDQLTTNSDVTASKPDQDQLDIGFHYHIP